jgi:signal transduction histidine kinase
MRDYPEEQRKGFLQTMMSEEERLSALINDFLDLERMAAGGQQLNLAPIELGSVVRRAVDAAGIDEAHPVIVDVASGLPEVMADEDRLMQVLLNLISNARKYSPEGGEVRVLVTANDRFLATTVIDQGLGIPPEARARLFEKFYRVHVQDHAEIKGTGLGLAICRQIVEAHGGRIWALSPGTGKGSTFGFSIPRVKPS